MKESPSIDIFAQPFLRWAGGKRKLLKNLLEYLPEDIEERTYFEPFLGAASLFFAVRPRKAKISDANAHLINCYLHVRNSPEQIHRYLKTHARNNSSEYYYLTRDLYNRSLPSAAQAARFIYLNKSCFNGIFRVNRKEKFNVPYGWKEPPSLPTKRDLLLASSALGNALLVTLSFEEALCNAGSNDFIYLDPPYPPLNGTSYFTHYTADRFNEEDQRELARTVKELDHRGCKLLMSNADTPLIRQLYGRFNLTSLPVVRYLTCKTKKHVVSELLITNY